MATQVKYRTGSAISNGGRQTDPTNVISTPSQGAYQDAYGNWYDGNGVPIENYQALDNPGGPVYPTAVSGARTPSQLNGGGGTQPGSWPGAATAVHSPHSDDWWLTHEPTNATEVQEAQDAYYRANAAGKTGWKNQDFNAHSAQLLRDAGLAVPNPSGDPNDVTGQQRAAASSAYAGANPSIPLGGMGGASGSGGSMPTTGDTAQDLLRKIYEDQQKTRDQNNAYIDGTVAPAVRNADASSDALWQQQLSNQQGMWQPTQDYIAHNKDIVNAGYGLSGWGNQQDDNTLAGLVSGLQGTSAQDQALFSGLSGKYAGYQQLQAAPYVGDAQSNPGDVARQLGAYNNLSAIGAGSLNYFSQASNAFANPEDLQRQSDAALLLERGSQGYFNTASQAEHAQADPRAVETQWDAMNRLGGLVNSYGTSAPTANDSAGLSAQKDALGQYKALTNPEVTAQERFIYEQARLKQEQDERNSRSAVTSDLRARGMGGSGMELTSMLGLQQQQSQNRLLSDLGAQSNAVSRSMQALQGYGNLGTNMQQQAQQALGMYTDAAGQLRSQTFDEAYKRGLAGDQTAIANANRMLSAAGMSADMATNMRNASFAEAYARGSAADAASANNQQTRLQGSIGAANQSNQIRTANDAMTTFNKQQQMLTAFHTDTYRADQQDQAAARDLSLANFGQTANNNVRGDVKDTATARANTTDRQVQRGWQALGADAGASATNLGAQQAWTNTTNGVLGQGIQNNSNIAGHSLALGGLKTGVAQQGTNSAAQALRDIAGDRQAGAAADAIESDPGGFLGLFTKNGILNVTGIPII